MPPWGCGNGSKGSCNGYVGNCRWQGVHWIQFEIGDDFYEDKNYFNKVYKEAVEFTAYICKLYNINPKGTVKFNGVNVPTILCHKDSYDLGLGSGHADVTIWFKKFGKTMQDVRNDVEKLLKESEVEVFKKGETSLGVYAMKRLFHIGHTLGVMKNDVADDGGYGTGTDADVKAVQKAAGLTQKSEADEATIRAAWKKVLAAVNKNISDLDKAKTELATTKKQLDAANKKIKELEAQANANTGVQGDADGDGKVTTKDLLFIRKLLAKKK